MKLHKCTEFNDFVFPDRLDIQLRHLMKQSSVFSPICFYGFPGCGKTSFAKFISDHKSNEVHYEDVNVIQDGKDNFGKFMERLKKGLTSCSLFYENEPWRKVLILDEFHNLRSHQQDRFKVLFDDWNDYGIQIIICLNITTKKNINLVLSSALRSRCECLNFSLFKKDYPEMISKVSAKFDLDEISIRKYLPDMRKIVRKTQLPEDFRC
tara:strand:- start:362 stop:988 length:627 start_codon:yes stop_codon:yes gene_type:complete